MRINPVIYLLLGCIVLGSLFFIFKPKPQQQNTPTLDTQSSVQEQSKGNNKSQATNNRNTFELVIKNKELVSGPTTITVNQGEEVTMKITSDEAEELHVHAYDESVKLEPNKEATLTFTADMSGRFPFELEESKTEIGTLEVQPQ